MGDGGSIRPGSLPRWSCRGMNRAGESGKSLYLQRRLPPRDLLSLVALLHDSTYDLLLELAVEAGRGLHRDAEPSRFHRRRSVRRHSHQPGGFPPASPGGPVSSISLRLPESLHKQARELAEREDISINQLIATALAEKMAALMTGEYLGERTARGSGKKLERVLKKVRERRQPPVSGDEL